MSIIFKIGRATSPHALRAGLGVAIAAAAMCWSGIAHAQASAMRVVKDPVTGELRAPTATEAAELDAADAKAKAAASVGKRKAASSASAPTVITHANGMLQATLDESSHVFSVAVRKADGSIDMQCITGKSAADEALKGMKSSNRNAVSKAKQQEHRHDHQ